MHRGLVLVATLLLLATPSAAWGKPRLSLTRVVPLTLVGRGFAPRMRIVLQVRIGAVVRTRHLRTTRAGHFTATFQTTAISRCSVLLVRVTQPNGTTTTLKRLPSPACLPAATP